MRMLRIAIATLAVVAGLAGRAGAGDDKAKAQAVPKMEVPKPPQEVADLVKSMAGTWKCKGQAFMPDGSGMDMIGTTKSRADLEKFWVHDSAAYKVMGGKMSLKFETFSTYDAALKKWRRVTIDSFGGQMVGISDGMKDMKMDYVMEVAGPMGTMTLKEHFDGSDPKAGARLSAERSLDRGKTWQKDYEVVCKR